MQHIFQPQVRRLTEEEKAAIEAAFLQVIYKHTISVKLKALRPRSWNHGYNLDTYKP